MANRDLPVVHQHFLHQRAYYLLTLPDAQRLGTGPQPFPETLQRLGDPQVPLPLLGGALDRDQFGLHRPDPTLQGPHPPTQLVQPDQFLLVRRHQSGTHSFQQLLLPSQFRHPPPSRIRPAPPSSRRFSSASSSAGSSSSLTNSPHTTASNRSWRTGRLAQRAPRTLGTPRS